MVQVTKMVKFKQEHATFWSEQLGVGGEFDTKEEEKENE